MIEKMKAAVLYGKGDLRIEEVEKPVPKEDEVLIKVGACGICESDHIIFKSGLGPLPNIEQPWELPIKKRILGHEIAGLVTAVGSNVRKIEVGDRVVISPDRRCNECIYCRRGGYNEFCMNMMIYGIMQDGGFAEYTKIHSSDVIRLPEGVTYEEGTFTEPIACCLRSFRTEILREILPGQAVAVFGAGYHGLILVQLAKVFFGAKPVISIEPRDDRREKAKSLGANIVVDPTTEDPVKRILEETQGIGVDFAIEAVGKISAINQAIDSVCKGGKVSIWGCGHIGGSTVQISPQLIRDREILLTGSIDYNPYELEKCARLIQRGIVRVKELTSHILPLEKLEQGFEIMEKAPKDYLKAIIKL